MLKIIFASFLFCASGLSALAAPTIQSIGAFTIYTSKDMKTLADWYEKFGFDVQFDKKTGVYWGSIKGQSGPPYIGIHPQKAYAHKKGFKNIALVFHVDDFNGYVFTLEKQGLKADSIDPDKEGHFAYYKDPDGNEMTIWGD